MALNALIDSFCHNQKKCGTERVKDVYVTIVFILSFNLLCKVYIPEAVIPHSITLLLASID